MWGYKRSQKRVYPSGGPQLGPNSDWQRCEGATSGSACLPAPPPAPVPQAICLGVGASGSSCVAAPSEWPHGCLPEAAASSTSGAFMPPACSAAIASSTGGACRFPALPFDASHATPRSNSTLAGQLHGKDWQQPGLAVCCGTASGSGTDGHTASLSSALSAADAAALAAAGMGSCGVPLPAVFCTPWEAVVATHAAREWGSCLAGSEVTDQANMAAGTRAATATSTALPRTQPPMPGMLPVLEDRAAATEGSAGSHEHLCELVQQACVRGQLACKEDAESHKPGAGVGLPDEGECAMPLRLQGKKCASGQDFSACDEGGGRLGSVRSGCTGGGPQLEPVAEDDGSCLHTQRSPPLHTLHTQRGPLAGQQYAEEQLQRASAVCMREVHLAPQASCEQPSWHASFPEDCLWHAPVACARESGGSSAAMAAQASRFSGACTAAELAPEGRPVGFSVVTDLGEQDACETNEGSGEQDISPSPSKRFRCSHHAVAG